MYYNSNITRRIQISISIQTNTIFLKITITELNEYHIDVYYTIRFLGEFVLSIYCVYIYIYVKAKV